MKSAHVYIYSILIGVAAPAFAGSNIEFVKGGERGSDAAEPSPVPAKAPVTASDEIKKLFGGKIPRVEDGAKPYANNSGKKYCRSDWNDLRKEKVVRQPMASTEVILAKAARAGISPEHIKRTLAVYFANRDSIPNQRSISVIDYNKGSTEKRLFIINLADGSIKAKQVAGGAGSDPNKDGKMTHFSNRASTNASSLGCSLAYGNYGGENGASMRLHGFESTNDQNCNRDVVVHEANYVGKMPGASWGCPAVLPADRKEFMKSLDGGGLICTYKDGEIKEAPVLHKKKKSRLKWTSKKKSKYKHRGKHGRRRR